MTEWFERLPGSEIARSQNDPGMLAFGLDKPDWVRVPEDTGFGGAYRCLEIRIGRCPIKGHDHDCYHYILDGPVYCAECTQDSLFLWYTQSTPGNKEINPAS